MILPAQQLVSVTFDGEGLPVFALAPFAWTGRPTRAADGPRLPVAWTSYQLGARLAMDEATFLATNAVVRPAFPFSQADSLVRLPRVLMFRGSGNADGITPVEMFAPLADALAAANVLVCDTAGTIAAFGALVTASLPPTAGYTEVVDVNRFTAFVPVANPDVWVGGDVLVMTHANVQADAPILTEVGWQLTDGVVNDDAAVNDAIIALLAAEFPRYRNFGCHLISTTGAFGLAPDQEAAAEAAVPAIQTARMAQLAPYGGTATILAGDFRVNRDAVLASGRQRAIDFFGLEV